MSANLPFKPGATWQVSSPQQPHLYPTPAQYQQLLQIQSGLLPSPAASAASSAAMFSRALERELPHELAAEPIVGWRLWNVTRQRQEGDELLRAQVRAWDEGRNPFAEALRTTTRLTAVGQPVRWDEPTMHATCEHPYQHHKADDHSPAPECGCGFWAFKERDQLAPRLGQALGSAVYGTVLLWGRVIEHADGYRAEYARPNHLHVPAAYRRGQELADELAAFYGCPAVLEETRPEWLLNATEGKRRREAEAERRAWAQAAEAAKNLPLGKAEIEKHLFFGRWHKH